MGANQDLHSIAHCRKIKAGFNLPNQPGNMCGRCSAHQQTKMISSLGGREPRVPCIVDLRYIKDRNWFRFEVKVQRL
jgi:hypothetical protein